jgi:hypothetical protein
MSKWFNENWFKMLIIVILAIPAFSIMYYYVCFLPYKHENRVDEKNVKGLVSLDNQEKCSKSAASIFKDDWQDSGSLTDSHDYKSHYNQNLNKCFIQETTYKVEANGRRISSNYLIDTFERKEYGSFIRIANKEQADYEVKPTMCKMLDNYCKSEDEYESFVAQYMEN